MSAQVRLKVGDSFVLDGTSSPLCRVLKVTKAGISVLKSGKSEPETISFADLLKAYQRRAFRHWPVNLDRLEDDKVEMLKSAFTAWPAATRREATRRLAYVSSVELRIPTCGTIKAACLSARTEVFSANFEAWDAEEKNAALLIHGSCSHRKGESFDGPAINYRRVKQPSARTIETWYADWRNAGRDICALIPSYHRRGCRSPFYKAKDRSGYDTYHYAKKAIDEVYMTLLRPPATAAWEVYKDFLEESGLPDTEVMSDRGFRDYIDRLYTSEEQCLARKGRKRSFLEHGIFIPQDLPDVPLDEVEIDHCLVDVILLHKNGRIAGRPWITVLLDRATRCVLGIHITFQPPSYHSVRLAIAHSAYPKDLSAFPSIKREWGCFGVPKYLISDQGKEFKCVSFKATCAALDIIPVPLPGRSPWLKGAIERLFGHMGIAVFDLMDGATKYNDVEAYRSAKSARLDKDEFTARVIRWIVDRYHHRPHPKLEERYGKGTTPDIAWQVLTSRYGIRLARDPEQVHLITGEVFNCRIRSDGIRIGPQWYLDKDVMERLRKRHGPGKVWRVHRDDTDWGYIRLLDDAGPVPHWITIPNVNREVMSGVSREQFKIILDEARQMTREGALVEVATLARAKSRLERESAALQNGNYKKNSTHKYLLKWTKYGDLGTLVTPVPGFEHQVIANDQDPLSEHESYEGVAGRDTTAVVSSEPKPRVSGRVAAPQADDDCLDDLADLIEERMKLRGARA